MGRPISWLEHLSATLRAVTVSKRTRYGTAEIQELFGVMERSAQKLMKLMPRFDTGFAFQVSREDLAAFLARVEAHRNAGGDVAALLDHILAEAPPVTREPLPVPTHVPRSTTPGKLPESIHLKRCHLEVSFQTSTELCQALIDFAAFMDSSVDFDGDYCARKPPASVGSEVRIMFEELEQMEAAYAKSA
jgi:hypothetical protein